MAKTLAQGRKPGSGRKPGKGKTLREGRKPGSGRRRKDGSLGTAVNVHNATGGGKNIKNARSKKTTSTKAATAVASATAKPKRKYVKKKKPKTEDYLTTPISGFQTVHELAGPNGSLITMDSGNGVITNNNYNNNRNISSRDLEALDALRELTTSPTFTTFNDIPLRATSSAFNNASIQNMATMPLPRLDMLSQNQNNNLSQAQNNKFFSQRMMNLPKDDFMNNSTIQTKNLLNINQQNVPNINVELPHLHAIGDTMSFQNNISNNSFPMNTYQNTNMNLNLHSNVDQNGNANISHFMNNRNTDSMANNQYAYNG
ncbi:hypothetical protein TPHA_0C04770 [Tetrapisispora phaffii CBS 4417]|uniref:Uncharacterized protein n=1 Tax=Tetrapisispora phaffii (strain ATCC 24235 / CBS 4417 / NBRC 1672 / NRRL Y-8282 / UCD 70-5) TaxID=1071381 RepID=G8BQW4_TETPH|nr:hypothetical protein TPHA_0C04770 [Tetrapisispora phaffii CBS 4417]CCE62626.1 hypothetical protein TPHA_0C04770 [Tetrapisispora phaffii CBS 4417]